MLNLDSLLIMPKSEKQSSMTLLIEAAKAAREIQRIPDPDIIEGLNFDPNAEPALVSPLNVGRLERLRKLGLLSGDFVIISEHKELGLNIKGDEI